MKSEVLNPQPKFKIGQKVYYVETKRSEKKVKCPACWDGKWKGRDGEEYECSVCYGIGQHNELYWYCLPRTEPIYITGYSQHAHQAGKETASTVNYYTMPEWDENHSVYTDSDGDARYDEDKLFSTFEEAQEFAKTEQLRLNKITP